MINLKDKESIKNYIGNYNYDMLYRRFHDYLFKYNIEEKKGSYYARFQMLSDINYGSPTKVSIRVDKNFNVTGIGCTCRDFKIMEECRHINLALMQACKENFIKQLKPVTKEDRLRNIIMALSEENANLNARKKAHLEIFLNRISLSFYGQQDINYELTIKVGIKKMYTLTSKYNAFFKAYNNHSDVVSFGKEFTYDPNRIYFSEQDSDILEFINDSFYLNNSGFHNRNLILNENKFKRFLNLLKDKPFTMSYENKVERNYPYVRTDFDCDIKLLGNKDKIDFKIDLAEVDPLTADYKYIKYNNSIYELSEEQAKTIKILKDNKVEDLTFEQKDIDNVSKILLPKLSKLSNNINISNDIQDKFIVEKPTMKFYFDASKNIITGIIKADYNGYEINILEDAKLKDKFINRDYEIENNSQYVLLEQNFKKNSDKARFELTDEDNILDFITTGIKDLTEKYEIYISEKLKKMNYRQKVTVKSEITLGSDQLLSYSFDMGDLDPKDLEKIFSSIRQKKKYVRLKNGSFLDLNNDDLQKANNILEELDADLKTIKDDTAIKLSKYKAIALDQKLKDEEMDYIKLDQNFNQLIDNFRNFKNTEIHLDPKEKDILREYQVTGVKWMATIAACGFGGILADEMGLGKSLQAITYIKTRLAEQKNRKFLIVAPTSLIFNWEREFMKFAPEIKVKVVSDTPTKRKKILKNIEKYNCLITSYGLVRQDNEEYTTIHFDTCIIDEAQKIKNNNATSTKCVKNIIADIKFALTGTPMENSIMELWSIFDFIMPGYLSNANKFRKNMITEILCDNKEKIEEFNSLISPFILRRRKKDVLKDLPDKLENNIYIELSDEEKKIYSAQVALARKTIDHTILESGFQNSKLIILQVLMRLRQICIDPNLYIEDFKEQSSKMANIVEIVTNVTSEGHKVLIFSNFKSALQILEKQLKQNGLTNYYLDGNTKPQERIALVDKFNEDDTNAFLISLTAGGTGLNLTSADIVIHLDPWWNPAVEDQATDRAHRIGQKNVVEVMKIIAKGTIEEKIVEIQNKKKELTNKIIEGNNRDELVLNTLTEEDLKNLLDTSF